MRRVLGIVLCFLLSAGLLPSIAHSADYYWRVTSSAILGGLPNAFDSASDACTAVYDRWGGSNIDYKTGQPAPLYVNDTTFQCRASYMDKNGTGPYTANTSTVTRLGDSCPPDTTYNSQIGDCDTDCSTTVGQTLLVRGDNAQVFNSNGTNYVLSNAPDSICTSSCNYTPSSSFAAGCYLVAGSSDTGFCNYIVEGTGESCSGQNLTPADMSGDPLNPPPEPTDPNEPAPEPDPCHGVPGYEWNGTTCIKTPDDGGSDGGGDDGTGDGSGDGTGGGTGGGTGDGGDSGTGDGGSGGGDDGSGDGSGGSTGGGGDDSSDNTGTASAGCDTPPSGSGDPLLAAILKQQWHTMCAGDELTKAQLEAGLTSEGLRNADTLENVLAEEGEDIDAQVSGVIGGLFSSGPSNACPLTDSTISTKWGSFELPWTLGCPVFNIISAMIFFFSYLAAGWILFDALVRGD
jgi:hypothetical protein